MIKYAIHIVACLLWRPSVGFQSVAVLAQTPRCTLHLENAPTWVELEAKLGKTWFEEPLPLSIDSALDLSKPAFSKDRPTLFRERHGWCPYSQRVWLALELSGAEYDTIRIDNTGGSRPSYYAGQTPQMRWPNGKTQGESMDLVDEVDRRYNDGKLRTQDTDVQSCISQFQQIFPRARPSSRAAYLFQYNGEPLWKSTFEETLTKTDALLGSNGGPFFCGEELTAADVAWAPFLERYRYQLPCLHAGLDPTCEKSYPQLSRWYEAMDGVPQYACRVKGNASSWRKVLSMAGFGNAGFPPAVQANADALDQLSDATLDSDTVLRVWKDYASTRIYVPEDGPHVDAASTIVRNRSRILQDTVKRMNLDEDTVDETMRHAVSSLLQGQTSTVQSNDVKRLAVFLDERMCVPRDMGALSAACIKALSQ